MSIELDDVVKILTAVRNGTSAATPPPDSQSGDAPAGAPAITGTPPYGHHSTLTPEQAAAFQMMMLIQGHTGETVGRGQVVDYKTGVQTGNPDPSSSGDPYSGIGPHTVPVYDSKGKLLGYTRPTGIYPKSMLDEHGNLKPPGTPGSENPLASGHPGMRGIVAEEMGGMWPAPNGYSSSGQPIGTAGGINPTTAAGVSEFAPGQKYGPFLTNPGIDPVDTGQASMDGSSGHQIDPNYVAPPRAPNTGREQVAGA